MLVFDGGFLALFRLHVKSGSGTASALAWFGLVAALLTASTFTILQAVGGIAIKIAVDIWYAFLLMVVKKKKQLPLELQKA
jgi:uncharacterized membrane protein